MIAKQIVQTSGQIEKMTQFIGQLAAISLKISSCASMNELMSAMDGAATAMNLVSSKMDGGKLANMLKNMQKSDMKMEMAQEMMDDIMEDLNEDLGDQEKEDELYQQVLQEAGVSLEAMPGTGPEKVNTEKTQEKAVVMEGEGGAGGAGNQGGEGGGDNLDDLLNSLQSK